MIWSGWRTGCEWYQPLVRVPPGEVPQERSPVLQMRRHSDQCSLGGDSSSLYLFRKGPLQLKRTISTILSTVDFALHQEEGKMGAHIQVETGHISPFRHQETERHRGVSQKCSQVPDDPEDCGSLKLWHGRCDNEKWYIKIFSWQTTTSLMTLPSSNLIDRLTSLPGALTRA